MIIKKILSPWIWKRKAPQESDAQWFYVLTIAIQLVLLWSFAPATIAQIFTILWASHLFSTYALGYFVDDSRIASIFFLLINFVLLIIGITNSFLFTLLSISISGGVFYFTEWIDWLDGKKIDTEFWTSIILHVIFVFVTFTAPFDVFIKLVVVFGLELLHSAINRGCSRPRARFEARRIAGVASRTGLVLHGPLRFAPCTHRRTGRSRGARGRCDAARPSCPAYSRTGIPLDARNRFASSGVHSV
jgi:hypothetical protein